MVKTYHQALDYIYSFIDYSLTKNLRYSPEKFNLNRMKLFLNYIGNPQQEFKSIHVAGTKGKGSTSMMLASVLTEAKFKTGLYTSPHMIEFTERIRIGDKQISHKSIINIINELEPIIKQIPELTTFEITTGMAFKYFADQKVNFAVVEVGMGGRFDATNTLNPEISIITAISHDHTRILGKTLRKIAFEKAGIIKPNVPVVVAKQKASPKKVIIELAREKKARLVYVPDKYQTESKSYSLAGQSFDIRTDGRNVLTIQMPLLGDHQIDNAATAFTCLEELRTMGYRITNKEIQAGFQKIKWPGRFEIVNKKPLVIVDGAHNSDSFNKLKTTLQKYLPFHEKIMIFGVSEDKDVFQMLKTMQPILKMLIITKSDHPRAMELDLIKEHSEKLGIPSKIIPRMEDSIGEAYFHSDKETVIIATGSIFIAGAVKNILKANK